MAAAAINVPPKTLEAQHPHPTDHDILYSDAGHKYQLWSKPTKRFFGVSELLNAALPPYNPMEFVPFLRKHHPGKSDMEIAALLEVNSEERREVGKALHKRIADFYNHVAPPDTDGQAALDKADILWQQFREFEFERDAFHVPYRVEWPLASADKYVCGTADLVCVNAVTTREDKAGRLHFIIYDFKCTRKLLSNKEGPEIEIIEQGPAAGLPYSTMLRHSLQLCLYANLLSAYKNLTWEGTNHYECVVDACYVVQFNDKRKHPKVVCSFHMPSLMRAVKLMENDAYAASHGGRELTCYLQWPFVYGGARSAPSSSLPSPSVAPPVSDEKVAPDGPRSSSPVAPSANPAPMPPSRPEEVVQFDSGAESCESMRPHKRQRRPEEDCPPDAHSPAPASQS